MRCNRCGTEWSINMQGHTVQNFCPVCGRQIISAKENMLSSMEETLRLIIRDYGIGNLQDSRRALAYFSDLAPHLRKEQVMLSHLMQCGGNKLLIAALSKTPAEQKLCINQIISRMTDDLFISETVAEMVCESFWNAISATAEPKTVKLSPAELYAGGCACAQTDPNKAVSLITEAAEAGNLEAQVKLADWYRSGGVTEKSPKKAFFWYTRASEAGDPKSQCNLGWCYATGFGCKVSKARAVSWFEKAAESGVITAVYNLAQCFELGEGVRVDYSRAAELYRQAAGMDHAKAQYSMGRFLDLGIGMPRDNELAIFWYTKAARNGSAEAQYALGRRYEIGNGLEKDLDMAYYWYRQAAENGHREGQIRLQNLTKK